MKQLENVLINSKPVHCEQCMGRIYYVGNGRYKCKSCDNHMMDDLGKVMKYHEENPLDDVEKIANATGVAEENVYIILSRRGMELPQSSKYYLNCVRCGCVVQHGRFCDFCTRELAGLIKEDLRSSRRRR